MATINILLQAVSTSDNNSKNYLQLSYKMLANCMINSYLINKYFKEDCAIYEHKCSFFLCKNQIEEKLKQLKAAFYFNFNYYKIKTYEAKSED